MRLRKVIGTGRLRHTHSAYRLLEYNTGDIAANTVGIPHGTMVEFSVATDTERTMVRPDDAEWVSYDMGDDWKRLGLFCGREIIALACNDGSCYFDGHWHEAEKTMDAAKRYVEQALADAGVKGFGWEGGITDAPTYTHYATRTKVTTGSKNFWREWPAEKKCEAIMDLRREEDSGREAWLYGITADGELTVLDACESETGDD